MRLLAILHRFGLNTALAAGLVMMPAVIAVGYWAEVMDTPPEAGLTLRGSLDGDAGDPTRWHLLLTNLEARVRR